MAKVYLSAVKNQNTLFFSLSPMTLLLGVIQHSNKIIMDDKQPIFGRQSVSLPNFFVAENIVHYLPNFVATWNPPFTHTKGYLHIHQKIYDITNYLLFSEAGFPGHRQTACARGSGDLGRAAFGGRRGTWDELEGFPYRRRWGDEGGGGGGVAEKDITGRSPPARPSTSTRPLASPESSGKKCAPFFCQLRNQEACLTTPGYRCGQL